MPNKNAELASILRLGFIQSYSLGFMTGDQYELTGEWGATILNVTYFVSL